jgi:LytS/YehU family sensor histidine kinase
MPEWLFIFFAFVIAVFTGMAIFFYLKWQSTVKSNIEMQNNYILLEQKIKDLELQTLESKLNPHLFKNILNSVQSHAYQTYYALDKLALVLDYILYESKNKYVTPRDEIDFALNLIEINKIKLNPLFELNIKQKINESEPLLEQKLLAPLISVDLIENAFKHADLKSADAFISITFEFKENRFNLTVANKFSIKTPLKKQKGGIGIQSLEQRLKLIYGKHFRLQRFTEDDVYIAHLSINLFEHKAQMLAAR